MRRLPPLNALRVFEVAARTNSYAATASELGLTHGAGRRMVATPAASAFAAETSLSFDRITTAADACGRLTARRILRVSAPSTIPWPATRATG